MSGKEFRSLFIGDLSVHCTEKDIYAVFQACGPIESVKVKQAFSHQMHSAYGFVTYMTEESAQRAMETLQGALLLGRPLKVNWAQRNVGKRLRPKDPTESLRTAQIHISYISRQTDAVISESSLRSLFSQFGDVVDVTIKKSQFDPRLCLQNGYGFVHYPMTWEGILSALKAIQIIHQVTIGPVTYDSTLSSSLRTIIEGDPYLWEIWQGFREVAPNETPVTSATRLPHPLENSNDGKGLMVSSMAHGMSITMPRKPSHGEMISAPHDHMRGGAYPPASHPPHDLNNYSTYFQSSKTPSPMPFASQPPMHAQLQPSYLRDPNPATFSAMGIEESRVFSPGGFVPLPISSSSSSPRSEPMDMIKTDPPYPPMFPHQQR